MRRPVDFRCDTVERLIRSLAVPALIGILVNLLFGIVDGIFIGRGIGQDGLAAVTVIFPFTVLVISLATLMGEGLASELARAIPANQEEKIKRTLESAHGMILALGVGVIALAISVPEPLVEALGATETTRGLALSYFRVIALGVPLMGWAIVYFHQLNAQGQTDIAVKAMVVSTVLNIGLDYLMIFPLGKGVAGAAWATVISQGVWLLMMHRDARRTPGVWSAMLSRHARIDFRLVGRMAAIGAGNFIRQVGVSLALILINQLASRSGSLYIASFGAVQRVLRLMIAPIAAVASALKPIVGQNIAMAMGGRVRQAVVRSLQYSGISGLFLLLVAGLFGRSVGSAFGIAEADLEIFRRILLLTTVMLPLIGVHKIATGYFMATGEARYAIGINLVKEFGFLIPLVFLFERWWGTLGMFIALPVSDLLGIGLSGVLLFRAMGKARRETSETLQ